MKTGFSAFIENVICNYEIGGIVALDSMAPFDRGNRRMDLETNPNPRLSAVVILVYPIKDVPHFALIERPDYDGVHARQIALPGGKKDDSDTDLEETALRELKEEVGVSASQLRVIGQLKEVYIPPSGFLVTPFLTFSNEKPIFIAEPREVKTIIEVPVSLLLNETIVKTGSVPVGNRDFKIKAPYFDIYGHKVWGATALILNDFKAMIK